MNIHQMPPEWFHPHGFKMSIQETGLPLLIFMNRGILVIRGSDAFLQITKSNQAGEYQLHWNITHDTNNSKSDGQRLLTEQELREAFRLSPGEDTGFTQQYKADTGIPGLYIRKGQFLNVPMPGTGRDDDPNISIFVSDEIKEVVRILIEKWQ